MPIWLHIILAVLITGYFIFRFIKDRYTYEMLFIIWVPSTLLTYAINDPMLIRCLGIFQVIMFILVVFFMFRRRGDHRQKTLSMITEMMADKLPDDDDYEEQKPVEQVAQTSSQEAEAEEVLQEKPKEGTK